ncbi:hypothetical protein [Kribbella sp. NPDC051718]|uniref:hypothetical protein n=1 Tax=Kribbella sp. NPDC051718 TaxID=3155168 RepID=UPI00342D5BC3
MQPLDPQPAQGSAQVQAQELTLEQVRGRMAPQTPALAEVLVQALAREPALVQ